MNLTLIPIVVDVPRMLPKVFEKRLVEREISDRVETTQTTALLGSTRIARRILETQEEKF